MIRDSILSQYYNKEFNNTFQVSSENLEGFTYVGLNTKQNIDFSVDVNQINYISAINLVHLTNDI